MCRATVYWRRYTNTGDKFLKKNEYNVAYWVLTLSIIWIFAKLFIVCKDLCLVIIKPHKNLFYEVKIRLKKNKKTTKYNTTTA